MCAWCVSRSSKAPAGRSSSANTCGLFHRQTPKKAELDELRLFRLFDSELCHRLSSLTGTAANDQVIGIIDHASRKPAFMPELLPCQDEPTEVQVGHHWR